MRKKNRYENEIARVAQNELNGERENGMEYNSVE